MALPCCVWGRGEVSGLRRLMDSFRKYKIKVITVESWLVCLKTSPLFLSQNRDIDFLLKMHIVGTALNKGSVIFMCLCYI